MGRRRRERAVVLVPPPVSRGMAWVGPDTSAVDRHAILGPGGAERVHAIEYGWLAAMQTATVYAYRFDADRFRPFGAARPHAFVAIEPVEPLGPAEPVGDLLAVHEAAGIELRLLPNLWTFWDAVVASTLEFSGIRLANARPWLVPRAPNLTNRQIPRRVWTVPITTTTDEHGIAEIVMDCPPVNALDGRAMVRARRIRDAGRRRPGDSGRRAAGRGPGFNAGVDIKEMQNTTGFDALIGANKGCFAAFAAVYDCPVPVIAAVHGFCVGGGIGLVGNSRRHHRQRRRLLRAARGRPRCARGRDPPGPARSAAQDAGDGVHVGHRDGGRAPRVRQRAAGRAARRAPRARRSRWPASIAAKIPTVIRAAKESLNGIDLWDVKRSYRFEQGFTFELNLTGVSDELRDDFAGTEQGDTEHATE